MFSVQSLCCKESGKGFTQKIRGKSSFKFNILFPFFTYYIHRFTRAANSKLHKTYSEMIDCDRRSDYGGNFYAKTTLQAFV